MIEAEASPAGAVHGTNVVNCAEPGLLVPEVQVAVTLQSYKAPELSPDKLAVVPVCAVDRLVQVEAVFNL